MLKTIFAGCSVCMFTASTTLAAALPQWPSPARPVNNPTMATLAGPKQAKNIRIQDGFLMNPHKPSAKGPWFEGWYTRITDSAGKRSMSIIAATFLKDNAKHEPGEPIPGYIAILTSEGDGAPTKVYEAFPEKTIAYRENKPAESNPKLSSESAFSWFAEGYGLITDKSIDLEIPGQISVKAQFAGAKAWGSNAVSGPEGIGGLMTMLPLHWYVHSLASETRYELSDNSRSISGSGTAHQEKNWGQLFPSAWIWMQATSLDGKAQLAATGGRLNLRIAEPETWLVGYRSEKSAVDFRPPLTYYKAEIDACKNTFRLTSATLSHTLVIEASAPESSFGPVSIPTKEGFKPGGKESFSAAIKATLYKNRPGGNPKFLETTTFTNAALEFGADYMRCP